MKCFWFRFRTTSFTQLPRARKSRRHAKFVLWFEFSKILAFVIVVAAKPVVRYVPSFRTCPFKRLSNGSYWKPITPSSHHSSPRMHSQRRLYVKVLLNVFSLHLDTPTRWGCLSRSSSRAAPGAEKATLLVVFAFFGLVRWRSFCSGWYL